jgi:Fe-S-cluster-containing dehydrogenase component
MDRREFLQMLGLVSGATLLSSCGSDKGQKDLISYLVPTEDGVVAGEADWRPSTCTECPAHCGIQARLREKHPGKLEGLSEHPINRGGLCIRGQAALWRLYHPERIKTPLQRTQGGRLEEVSWEQALNRIAETLQKEREQGRSNLYLSGRTTGTLARLIEQSCQALPLERLPEFEPFSHAALRQGYELLFNRKDIPRFQIEKADLLLTVGADVLETFVSPVNYAAQLTRARQQKDFEWIHVEPHMSLTGANASLRLTPNPGAEPHLLSWLLQQIAASDRYRNRWPAALHNSLPSQNNAAAAAATGLPVEQLEKLARDFIAAQRPLLIIGGLATAHSGGHAAAVLGGLIQWLTAEPWGGIDFTEADNYGSVGSFLDLARLSDRLAKDEVGVLLISRCNPVLHAAKSLDLRTALSRARLRVGLAELPDETTDLMDLVLPLPHSLESWGDVEPRQGLRSLLQPMLVSRHNALPEGDILLRLRRLMGDPQAAASWQDYLKSDWQRNLGQPDLRQLLNKGFLANRPADRPLQPDTARTARVLRHLHWPAPLQKPVAVLTPSIRTFDGRSRALPLLNEIPDPLTTISYGNWVSIAPETASGHNLKDSRELRLTGKLADFSRPVKIQPGLPPEVLSLPLDSLETPTVAVDPETGEAVRYLSELRLRATGSLVPLPILAGSPSQKGRGIIPEPLHLEKEHEHKRPSLYPEPAYDKYRWTMAIDLERCIGCGACAAACYVENSVPLVGEKEHLKGREMSWLHIESFYDEEGRVEFIPMLCQQCAYAPCEPVCPVYAAHRSAEGLNVQVYARCVGTRYCSNNCPYKVRRFNWWEHDWKPPLDKLHNPDVAMRGRGIMEKCTFCIQRLRVAKDRAKDENRLVRDGEATPACAQSCPTGAIVFGNLLDTEARIHRLIREKRSYRVFSELGTEPSVYYLRPESGVKPEPTAT